VGYTTRRLFAPRVHAAEHATKTRGHARPSAYAAPRERERLVKPMRPVVEHQHVPIRQHVRRVLPRERRSPELPVDGAGPAVDHDHRGDIAETQHQVSVGHLGDAIGNRPHVAVVLDGGDDVFRRIEMLPASPLPDGFALGCHLDEIRGIHVAVFILGPGSAAAHFGDELCGKRFLTNQKQVAVLQADAVVIMIGVVHLPENPSVPIHFQRRATHVRRSTDVGAVRNLPVVEKRPALGEISRLARRVGHIPGVRDVTAHIDQIDRFVGRRQRAEQGEAVKRAPRIVPAQADPATLDRRGFDRRRPRGLLLRDRFVGESGEGGRERSQPARGRGCSYTLAAGDGGGHF